MKTGFIGSILSSRLEDLVAVASEARRKGVGSRIEVCGIVNAKSGKCAEDCRFCAQSSHYSTEIPEYPLKSAEELLAAAKKARDNGASRFGIVTSGNRLADEEIGVVAEAVRLIVRETGIGVCASLGALDEKMFKTLKEAGLTRYHHNLETSRNYYPRIVSTHSYDERIGTVMAAKSAGLEVCSGGIIGMGETWQDRLEMALTLKELGVDAVPLNILVPIKGTPLGAVEPLSAVEALRAVALFRLILNDKDIKVIAGRETVLKDSQILMYMAGANGMMVGGYLTVGGRGVDEDKILVKEVRELWRRE